MKILVTKLNAKANAMDQDHFACSTQLDVIEPETYNKTMRVSYAAKWSQAMGEELDQLEKNNTWELVHKDQIEKDH